MTVKDPARQQRLVAEMQRYHATDDDYDAASYWDDRFHTEGLSWRAVGDRGKTKSENGVEYAAALDQFLLVLGACGVSPSTDRVVEIGCGIGAHLRTLHGAGFAHLTGVDITDRFQRDLEGLLFKTNFQFVRADVGVDTLRIPADIFVICDVMQHIIHPDKIRRCLTNVLSNLQRGGVLVFTDLFEDIKYSYYEQMRTWQWYRKMLQPSAIVVDKTPYRDKYITAWRIG